jgi:thiol-disulfide isomerase/thioredoxin
MRITRRDALACAFLGSVALRGQAAEPGYEWRPWPRGKRVPLLELDALDGPRWRLSAQRGRVVLVNFWATWCEPCRAEMPALARLAQQREAEGLSVVAANYREGASAIQRFFERLGVSLPVILDRDGAAAAAWTPRVLPSTVIFDRQGHPAGVLVGELDWEGGAAQALLDPLLAAPAIRKARL